MSLVYQEILRSVKLGSIGISPFSGDNLQPNSYEVALGPTVKVYLPSDRPLDFRALDPEHDFREIELPYVLPVNGFALGCTVEHVRIGGQYLGRLHGCSTEGRGGLLVHATAGHLDTGFIGQVTLELKNVNDARPILLTPGMRIGQLEFIRLADVPYFMYGDTSLKSRYQNQKGPTAPTSQVE